MKICKICIQPDTRPGIYFNEHGVCGACIWEEEKKKIDWDARTAELHSIAEWAKNSTKSNYDCVIGVSGGKDSTTQAFVAKERLGLRCLLVNCEPDGITELGRYNIENLKKSGFDVISLRPNPQVLRKLVKRDFYKYLNPVKITEFSLWASTYIIADKFDVPLVIQGDNPGLSLGVSLSGVGTDSNALKANELQTISSGWEEYIGIDGVDEKDLYLYHYDRKKLEKNGCKGIWLNYFLKAWSSYNNAVFSREHGFKWLPEDFDLETIGTSTRYGALDGYLAPVNQLLKHIKFGFGQCVDQVCYDIRDNLVSRKEGIELVKKYDGKCSDEYIEKFCNYIQISKEEFWSTAEKFRGPMWKKDDNRNWYNTFLDFLK